MASEENISEYNKYVALGERAMNRRDHARALQLFARAGTYYPHTLGARINIAMSLHCVGCNDEARRDFESLYAQRPNHTFLIGKYAYFSFNTGDYDLALKLYEKYLEHDPQSVACYLAIGRIRMKQGAYRSGLECFERAKELVPEEPEVAAQIGWAKLMLEDTEGAIQELRTVLKREPDYQKALLLLTVCLQKKSLQEKSLVYWGEMMHILTHHRYSPPFDALRTKRLREYIFTPLYVVIGIVFSISY